MDAADDVARVKEPKCALVHVWNKPNLVEAFWFPPGLMFLVDCKPMHPKDIHVGQMSHRMMEHLDPVDRQNACIDVWVKRVPRECHHIWTAFHVDLVLSVMEIVSGVIHSHCVLLLKAITRNEHLAAVVLCEGGRLLLILTVKDASEKVVLEVWDEVLW